MGSEKTLVRVCQARRTRPGLKLVLPDSRLLFVFSVLFSEMERVERSGFKVIMTTPYTRAALETAANPLCEASASNSLLSLAPCFP